MKVIGIGIGTATGLLLGRYALYPIWRNRQTDITKAVDPAKQTLFTVVSAIVGAVTGYYLTRSGSESVRTKKRREINDAYYGYGNGFMADKHRGQRVMVLDERETGDVTIAFIDQPHDTKGRYLTAYTFNEGHGPASMEYLREITKKGKRSHRILTGEAARFVMNKYDRTVGQEPQDYKILASVPRHNRLSDKTKNTARSNRSTSRHRTSKTIQLGKKKITVSVLRDGAYQPIVELNNPALQSFMAMHPKHDKEVILLAAETVAGEHGIDGLNPNRMALEYGALRLPFSLYTALGKQAMLRQMKMSEADAERFAAMSEWAMESAKRI